MTKKIIPVLGWGVLAGIVFSDLGMLAGLPSGKVGVVFWMISWVLWVVTILVWLGKDIKIIIRNRTLIAYSTSILLFGTVVSGIWSPSNLSGETTQQIGCALKQLAESPNKGFQEICMFGYPTRQYYVPALLSLIGKRDIGYLNGGAVIYLFMGLTVFVSGLLRVTGYTKRGDLLAGSAVALLMHSYFFNSWANLYDQSFFPVVFSLLWVGVLVRLYAGEKVPGFLVGFLMLYSIYSYTPGLALFFLIVGFLVGTLSTKNRVFYKREVLLLLVFGSVSFFSSFGFRKDVNLFETQDGKSTMQLEPALKEAGKMIFYTNGGAYYRFASPFLISITALILILLLTRKLGKSGEVVGVWIVGVLLIAIFSKGYAYNSVDFRLHRFTFAFPVLIGYGVLLGRKYDLEKWDKKLMLMGFFVFLFSGVYFNHLTLNGRMSTGQYEFISFLKKTYSYESYKIFFSERSNELVKLENLNDFLVYFLPGVEATRVSTACEFNQKGLYAISPLDGCKDKLGRNKINTYRGLVLYNNLR